jgi:hypothetical protein
MRVGIEMRQNGITRNPGGGVDLIVRWALEDGSGTGQATINVPDLQPLERGLDDSIKAGVATQLTALGYAVTSAEVRFLPGPASPGPLLWGADNLGLAVTSRFLLPGGGGLLDLAALTALQIPSPRALTLYLGRVVHNILSVDATLITYTLRVAGAPTALTIPLAANAASASLTLPSASRIEVAAGALLDIEVTKAGVLTVSPGGVYFIAGYL